MNTENRWRLSREGPHSYERRKGREPSLKCLVRLPKDRWHFTEVWNKNLGVVTQVKGRQEKSHPGTKRRGGPRAEGASSGCQGQEWPRWSGPEQGGQWGEMGLERGARDRSWTKEQWEEGIEVGRQSHQICRGKWSPATRWRREGMGTKRGLPLAQSRWFSM